MLANIWFVLIGVLFVGYAIFDGFDLGSGVLYPFLSKSESDKAVVRAAVGPVWDGNEVWLLTAGGAIFAAFPAVYATVFSGFYLALMLVLFSLIIRGVSLEFRHSDKAKGIWDWGFFIGSALPSLLFGVAAGNIIRGVPLTTQGEFGGTFFTLLNPFSLVCGLLGLAWFITQGASWISLKSTGDLAVRARKTRKTAAIVTIALGIVASIAAAIFIPKVFNADLSRPLVYVGLAVFVVGLIVTVLGSDDKTDLRSFLGSCAGVIGLVIVWASSIFPDMVPTLGPGRALSIAASSSSNLTLTVMLIITAVGLPLVLFYIFTIYRSFRGRNEKPAAGEELY